MDTYRTEEEQVEALKKWWDDNGRSTLIAIVVAVAATLGWQGYQEHRVTQAEAASQVYEDLLEALAPDASGKIDETRQRTAEHLATQLKTEYTGSTYSGFAGLLLAKSRVEQDDLPGAEEELRWVLANVGGGEVGELAQVRLARVLAAQGEHEQALTILDAIKDASFSASIARARGDIYLATGRTEQANAAYQESIALGGDTSPAQQSLLAMQVAQLNPVPARASAIQAASDPEPEQTVEEE